MALTQLVRTAAQQCAKAAAARSTLSASSALVRAQSTAAGSKGGNKEFKKKPRGADAENEGLYDPYKEYQESSGTRGYREFNPDLYQGEDLNFTWEEPEQMMADKSWPATSGSDLFADLFNVSGKAPSDEKLELILAEAFKRMGHKGINAIELPDISVKIDENDPDREALEIMKLSLLNNGRIKMDDKNEIMKSLIDEIDHLRKDKTTLFKGLE
uniref:Uncharacterized protein n=1 Tax=Globisporangium ultimum (strain ATCC 200006 / CBS 805.95 / DAOM BR144) TaxID=431595 RepID=K3WUH5_GLOUD